MSAALKQKNSFIRRDLPSRQMHTNILAWLAEGFSMEEVLELANEECNTSPAAQDLSAALEQPITMRSFVVVEGKTNCAASWLHRLKNGVFFYIRPSEI